MADGIRKYEAYEWKYTRDDFKYCPRCGNVLSAQDLHIEGQPQLVCDSCKFIFYLDPKIVVTAVVLHQDRALLLRRAENPGKDKWGLPGGYVTRGESIITAIAKEVFEESSINFVQRGILECLDLPENQGLQIIFWGDADNGIASPNIESSEARFFGFSEIPWDELAFDATRIALELCSSMLSEPVA